MIGVFVAPIHGGIQIEGNKLIAKIEINKIKAEGPTVSDQTASNFVNATPLKAEDDNEFGCGLAPWTWFTNCIAAFLFNIIYKPVAEFTFLAAKILDFFVYYSTNSSSYKSDFILKGWGAVRDVANIFFIIALLYVAIKTVLGLNISDNKAIVKNVILFALLINFSLFTTKVVIDTSNILAKIFYNQITPVNEKGEKLKPEEGGQKSVTVGLVRQFNPTEIIKGKISDQIGEFVFITLLSIAIMGYMIYMFLSVALLFVGRVVGLWISMIFSPIAFASYTLPFNIPGFGHKEWWPELIKTAFLAPIFIFFLYIIILFGDFLKIVPYGSDDGNWLTKAMFVIIPFAIIFILLMKAKELAVKFSGEIGAAINGMGKTLGGFAVGAVTGGAAVALSSTVGARARNVANDETLKAKAAAGDKDAQRTLAKANKTASRSFDLRDTGVGKMFQKKTGLDLNAGTDALNLSTKNTKGGRTAVQERAEEKAQKVQKSYEMSKSASILQDSLAAAAKPREDEYKKDKEEAKKLAKDLPTPEKEIWEKEYKIKEEAARRSTTFGVFNEKKFKEDYEKTSPIPLSTFDEEKFRNAYIAGGKLNEFGLNKTVKGGSVEHVQTSKEVNTDRKMAYALSIEKDARVETYKTDRRQAKRKMQEKVEEDWNKEYEDKKNQARSSAAPGTFNEKQFKKDYMSQNPIPASNFNEKKFKEKYEAGGSLSEFGIAKTVDAGEVNLLKESMNSFWEEWKAEAKDMLTTSKGLAITGAATAVAGPAGGVVAVAGVSFLKAFKEIASEKWGITTGIKKSGAEIVAAIRKGQDPLKHALHEISKLTADHGDHGDDKGDHGGGAHAPAPKAPAAAPAAPAGGGHDDHSH